MIDPRFCPLCAAELVRRSLDGHERKACSQCEFVHFADPKLAVGVLVEDAAGRLLYTLRNHEPGMGEWALPSGFVDRGEEVEAAARREVREETGLKVELAELVGVFSRDAEPVVFIVFRGRPLGGELVAGPEADDVRYFHAEELPPPVFPSDAEIVERWRALPRLAEESRSG